MIKYPAALKPGDTIAVSAPSNGVEEGGHFLVHKAKKQLEEKGFNIIIGDTVWTQENSRSCSPEKRRNELMDFFEDPNVKAIIPIWGGEFLMEILPYLDWERLQSLPSKWILGYSDISTLLFSYTVLTGHASAHGPALLDIAAKDLDPLTNKWSEVLGSEVGSTIIQTSSEQYQSSWEQAFANPVTGFYVDTPTEWKALKEEAATFSGRFIGGCIDCIMNLTGTKFGDLESFNLENANDEGLIFYFENVELSVTQLYRALWQLRQNGWFENVNGILIGRPVTKETENTYTYEDALRDAFGDLNIPVIYDTDIGHLPPQNIIVNGAYGTVKYEGGKGVIETVFK
ncbi:S66 peptidase family protein [Cytobacillus sp. FJAT-54145]|uniref:S66 peptidase family protein n=1 Tax=Cytobacillus spartinae TaxID=3299023 RepID=A0ABW6K8J4_9BACI